MKTLLNWCVMICFAVAFAACRTDNSAQLPITQVIHGFDTIRDGAPFVKSVEILALDSSHPLTAIQKVEIIDSLIVVLERNSLSVFNRDGSFRNEISRKGRAETEWIRLDAFASKKDTIILFDGFQDKLLYFDLKGNHLRTVYSQKGCFMNISDASFIEDETLFCQNLLFGDDSDIFSTYNIGNNTKKAVFTTALKSADAAIFTGRHSFLTGKDSVLFVAPKSNLIYNYSIKNGNLTGMEIETSKKVLDNEELKAISDYSPFQLNDEFPGFSSIFEVDGYYVLTFYDMFTTFISKKSKEAWTIHPGHNAGLFPFLNLIGQDGNKLIGCPEMLSLFLGTYQPSGNDSQGIIDKLKNLADSGSDNILLFYTIE